MPSDFKTNTPMQEVIIDYSQPTFEYERKDEKRVINFNPELYGFPYHECKCSSVKFRRDDGRDITELHIFTDTKRITVHNMERQRRGDKDVVINTRSFSLKSYPANHSELGDLLKAEFVI